MNTLIHIEEKAICDMVLTDIVKRYLNIGKHLTFISCAQNPTHTIGSGVGGYTTINTGLYGFQNCKFDSLVLKPNPIERVLFDVNTRAEQSKEGQVVVWDLCLLKLIQSLTTSELRLFISLIQDSNDRQVKHLFTHHNATNQEEALVLLFEQLNLSSYMGSNLHKQHQSKPLQTLCSNTLSSALSGELQKLHQHNENITKNKKRLLNQAHTHEHLIEYYWTVIYKNIICTLQYSPKYQLDKANKKPRLSEYLTNAPNTHDPKRFKAFFLDMLHRTY